MSVTVYQSTRSHIPADYVGVCLCTAHCDEVGSCTLRMSDNRVLQSDRCSYNWGRRRFHRIA